MKTYITRQQFEGFKSWLVDTVGVSQSPCTNDYELIRWQHHLPGKPMPICFRRDKSNKITLNGEAANYYADYQRRIKNAGNVH